MIKNREQLVKGRFSKERADALSALESALERINPEVCIKRILKIHGNEFTYNDHRYSLNDFEHIYLIAFGKAADRMALSVFNTLSEVPGLKISNAVVVSKEFKENLPNYVKKIKGGHPLPDENSIKAGQEILKLAGKTTNKDLTLVLISGGGSAMVESPLVPLDNLQQTTKLLMEAGANINELNTVRKHLSNIKGGKLLTHLRGQVISLIISDVIGDKLDTIASGPTYFDNTTFQDALKIIDKYSLRNKIPEIVLKILREGIEGKVSETLKENSPDILRVQNILVATNFDACNEAVKYLKSRGYTVLYLGSSIQGEAREVAKVVGGIAMDGGKERLGVPMPIAVIFGGETTVTVKGNGIGGRNEELVLASLPFLAETQAVFTSVGTDGIDGKSYAAGAIADSDTLTEAKERGLDFSRFLINNDAHNFFNSIGGLVVTGNTGTNVADIGIMIIK